MSACEAVRTTQRPVLDPTIWLERHGDYLYKYAMLRLRDSSVAEDVVQETLLAALKSCDRFEGESNERTWLVGILKHKIIDYFRRGREIVFADLTHDEEFFDEKGVWKVGKRPSAWDANPESVLRSKDFQRTLALCLNQLPDALARVFILRELNELTTEEICELLNITPGNLWVMLHRARLRLQHLLDLYWFKNIASDPATSFWTIGDSFADRTA